MKGYLDRIEDGKFAIVLVDEMKKEFMIPISELPNGSKVQSYFDLTIEKGEIVSIKLDEQTTVFEKEEIHDLMTKVRSKRKESKFKKK